jgi:hypothetical protein
MWIVVVGIMLLPEVEGAYGVQHPEFESMKYGGSGSTRHGHMVWLGWAFGTLVLMTAVSLMAFGARRGDRLGGLGPRFGVAAAVFVAIFTWLVVAYIGYMNEPSHRLFLGFPAPTAIMLYVFFPYCVVFNVLFVWSFNRWLLPPERLEAYQSLREARRARLAADDEADPHGGSA